MAFVTSARYAAYKVQIAKLDEVANSSPVVDIPDLQAAVQDAHDHLVKAFASELAEHALDGTLSEDG